MTTLGNGLSYECTCCSAMTTNGSLIESCPKRKNGYRHVWKEIWPAKS